MEVVKRWLWVRGVRECRLWRDDDRGDDRCCTLVDSRFDFALNDSEGDKRSRRPYSVALCFGLRARLRRRRVPRSDVAGTAGPGRVAADSVVRGGDGGRPKVAAGFDFFANYGDCFRRERVSK